ncbi:hypothetical protein BCR37DRAFT_205090 [Protomyces lactucae-debilis]|uniref:Uncharacterized protein n=1 Tax=Protomyces lactucae-debilis TaxID=2754530 RepID=A0A1Y2FQ64_PROLT|nr:uncharacterized protein BCR37DRAFT_205090 [Protomyces lactucae-debilis]ORY86133.1 hypothetical protein BCR37DRAFT_205090 [Protomyces lactucae-debilis]
MFRRSLSATRQHLAAATKQTSRQSSKRFNSSHAAGKSGDAKWALGAVAVTVPALAYLLAPPGKKADAHKAVHTAQAKVGLKTDEERDAAIEKVGDEVHGPQSRSDPAKHEQAQSQSDQAKTESGKSQSQAKENTVSSGDIKAKQSGISNTETKHKVDTVTKDGENPSAKSQETIDPTKPRGQEKKGPSKPAPKAEEEEDDDEEEDDEEDDDEEDEEEEKK